ncbi:MAG: helix-turn-helix domain-containing protein [Pseudonocardiales bacterium]|nr:helix-turn-helix domain-containing protein [Pseudonocardiales bacterium]MBV9727933.1 helix-turn-helix domain-containing protein [Pseudonocardiales bacterium]
MSREPEAITAQRRQLGAALATFRQAAGQSQAQLGLHTRYDRTSINKIERGQQLPDRPFWQAVDRLLHAEGALLKRYDELVASKREHAQRQRQSSRARHQVDAARLRGERAPTPALLNSDPANEPANDPEHEVALSAPWSHQGTVEASVVLRGGESRVQRRRFVFLTGTALTAPAHQWLVHEPGPLVSGLSGRRVSAKLIDRLMPMVSELRRWTTSPVVAACSPWLRTNSSGSPGCSTKPGMTSGPAARCTSHSPSWDRFVAGPPTTPDTTRWPSATTSLPCAQRTAPTSGRSARTCSVSWPSRPPTRASPLRP